MTLGSGSSHAESAMAAYARRQGQLESWRESETAKESSDIRNRPKRIKFADKCIFQAACASADKAMVARMIRDGYDINAVDEDGITALHQACIDDNFEMVEFLLKNGADVNMSDNEGWTPLHAVASCSYVSITKLLLENGADVVALNNDCCIPLDICKNGEIKELFIQEINGRGIDLQEARRAEEMKMMEDARRWISSGVYEEAAHPLTGATGLHVAACKGYIKVIDLLITAGADINAQDLDGWTPLHAAAHWGQKEACEVLLEHNCDMNVKNNCDQTALDVADDSVVPILEDFKKKHSVNNKNIESVGKGTNILPLPPKKKPPKATFDEGLTIVTSQPGGRGGVSENSSNGSEEEEEASEAADTVSELPTQATAEPPGSIPPPDHHHHPHHHHLQDEIPTTNSIFNSNNNNQQIIEQEDRNITNLHLLEPQDSDGGGGGRIGGESASPKFGKEKKSRSEVVSIGAISPSTTASTCSSSTGTATPSSTSSSTFPSVVVVSQAPGPPQSEAPSLKASGVFDSSAANADDDSVPAWRRGGSLRTRTNASTFVEDKGSDRAVRRTRSEASSGTDVNLRRAYSFESDSTFYTRLTSARNRIKAIEAASAAMTANLLDGQTLNSNNHDHNHPPTPLISSSTTTSSSTTPTTTTQPTNQNHNPPHHAFNNLEVILRRKDTDVPRSPRPTTISTSSPRNLSSSAAVNANSVQVRRSFVPPARDEESETQRKAHAKRVRETRRSTQGVTLEELKSAEQYVKNSQQQQQQSNANPPIPENPPPASSIASVPGTISGSSTSLSSLGRKELDDQSLERRPSWRLRVDDTDRNKFSLEDTRTTSGTRPSTSSSSSKSNGAGGPSASSILIPWDNMVLVQRSPSSRRSNKAAASDLTSSATTSPPTSAGSGGYGKPPRPPQEDNNNPAEDADEKDKEMKNLSGAQGAILRKTKKKRRSTGVVQFNADGADPDRQDSSTVSDTEVGSGSVDQTGDSSRSENGVNRINYRKLYEEILKENVLLKSRLSRYEEEMADLKVKLEKVQSQTPRIALDSESERRERRALEIKLEAMELELREVRHLKSENQKIRDENGALIRVISKLSK